jgi:pyruvate dehydrogenase E2 component (dihydrolipoamide acetyltransferase)
MEFKLPKLGEGAESGTVVSILVKEGDAVEKGQTLLELENEKAVAPIPAPVAGTVTRLRVKEGDVVSVGRLIASIAESGAPAVAPAPKTARPAEVALPEPEEQPVGTEAEAEPEPEPEAAPAGEGPEAEATDLPPAASPSIRRLARELGIELARVRGSERGGRIVMGDLKAYIQRLQKLAFQPKRAPAARPVERLDFAKWGPVTCQPVSALRRTVAERMTESWTTIPRVTQFDEADITALNDLRKKHGPAYEAKGVKLTLTSFALRVVVDTLKRHPIFNSSLDEATNELILKQYYHLSLAVDTEHGLIVPVLRDADRKSLLELTREMGELAEKARARKVSLEELQGGTFTISNQGGIGGAHFTPIVYKPQVAILGLGRGALKPVVKDGRIEPRLMLPLGLSYDHRVIDGGSAARFMVELVRAFENFPEEAVAL